MEINQIALFSQIIQAQNINFLQLEQDFSNLYKADLELRCKLYSSYKFDGLRELITANCHESEILKVKDDFALTSFFIQVGGAFSASQNVFLAVGPILETQMDISGIQKIMFRKKLPEQILPELQAYYGNVPVPSDVRMLESTILTVAESLFSRRFQLAVFPEEGDVSLETPVDKLVLNDSPSIAIRSIEERYEVEEKMLDAIASGDHSAAVRWHSLFKTYRVTPRNDNELLNSKNLMIVLNTLCRKSVQKSHVHPVYIDDISTKFAIRINKANFMNELNSIENELIHKYCLLVRNHSMGSYSQSVQRCIVYTDFHYAEPLTLAFFAEMCHVTKSYLSSLFKKETGSNLTDYIHMVRVRHALVLLNATDLPIHVVAFSCGYNDINYFIKVFKKANGISPKQYRLYMHQK